MALYRRFAVYLYQYQGAKKGAGAGFGMIELRDGRIRMQLTGRGSVAQGNLDVYGLLDAPEDMAGIRLGSMQAGHFVLEAGESIGEGKNFSDLRGIVLTSRPGAERAVAALWNGTFDAGRFVQWKAPEVEEKVEVEVEVPPVAVHLENVQTNSPEKTMTGDEIAAEIFTEEEYGQFQADSFAECRPEEVHASPEPEKKHEEEISYSENSVEHLMESSLEQTSPTEDIEDRISENEVKESLYEKKADSIPLSSFTAACPDKDTVNEESSVEMVSEMKGDCEDSQLHFASAALDLIEFGLPLEIEQEKPRPVRKISESVLWQHLSKQYPKMKIPMQGQSVLCLRIRPCDINRLPKANWKYGCSHFLARHYNRYRCLIVGRVLHEDGYEYFMGIPGGNTTQERMQAAQAGFDHYIGIERTSPQWPEGFWLVQLQWEE